MAKRNRDFLRIAMTARTAQYITENLVDKTFKDHFSKCDGKNVNEDGESCPHVRSGSLRTARMLEAGLKIGKKRATLDIPCPYRGDGALSPASEAAQLKVAANRIRRFSTTAKTQVRNALQRIADAVQTYAERNAMQVIAEAAL